MTGKYYKINMGVEFPRRSALYNDPPYPVRMLPEYPSLEVIPTERMWSWKEKVVANN
jgi:hypothetical protein